MQERTEHRHNKVMVIDGETFRNPSKQWRPYRESNPGYLREREVS